VDFSRAVLGNGEEHKTPCARCRSALSQPTKPATARRRF